MTVADADNGDEAYGYCDTITFAFDMATDLAADPDIDMYALFHFANPKLVGGVPQCDVPFHGECPVYDATNSSSYTSAWSDDGASYVVQLACPVPEGTPTLADGNTYAGSVPRPYLFDARRRSPHEWFNHSGDPSFVSYPVHVARLQLGVTTVRLRADVRNRARNIPQPTLTGAFGSLESPTIVSYVASNYDNTDSIYGDSDRLTLTFDKPTDKARGERYGLKTFVDGLFSFSEGDPADDYSGEWTDDSTFVVTIIDPIDVIPSVAGRIPYSTRASDLAVATAGGAGLPGAMLQNRASLASHTVDPGKDVSVRGSFGAVRTPELLSFVAVDADNGDDTLSLGDVLTLSFSFATDRGGAARSFYPEDAANRVSRAQVLCLPRLQPQP